MSILKKGLKGAPVKRLQEKLGVKADGDFGPGTEKAVREFQEKNSLTVDGMAGPETLAKTGAFKGITAATVAAAAVKADEEAFDGEPLPELKDNAVVAASSSSAQSKSTDQIAAEMKATIEALAAAKPAAAPAPEKKSVWSKVKGWF